MFRDFPGFMHLRSQHAPGRESGGIWWLVMAPGLGLVGAAIAIIIWPELLAYAVASLLLGAGSVLLGWGWRLRQLERGWRRGGPLPRYRGTYEPDNWTG
jgi:hypothetical protein